MSSKNVCIVVLGDIGRSPRMQYHALSLAEQGHKVDIIGYGETQPLDKVKQEPLVYYHYLNPYPEIPLPRFLRYIIKTIWQAVTLLFALCIIRKPDFILVQNPPAIPALIVCWVFKNIVRSKLIIDWHNYAHTIMGLSVGSENPLVKLTKKMEFSIGRKAHMNFCVTNAMKKDLLQNWNVSATTLYDRPPEIFKPISLEEKHELLSCLCLKYKELLSKDGTGTIFTYSENGVVHLRPERPGILISSTSWTEDEDFSVLVSALQDYEEHCSNGNVRNLPKLVCFITGKGPLKDFYCRKISALNWKNISVITPWLEPKDYALLLASADLGVCLHTSSSGLDLPMKIVDMFGCGLPVCAHDFQCLDELVKHGETGYIFKTAEELSQQLQNWFENFPSGTANEISETFKIKLEVFQKLRWRENWLNVAAPAFK